MNITGFSYLLFLAAVLVLHRLLQGRAGAQRLLLIVASYYFYMTFDWRFAGLLLVLTAVNYLAGARIAGSSSGRERRTALALAILSSLAILFYFKYFNFFAGSVNAAAAHFGLNALLPHIGVILPIGISFLTFQAITYPIDIYLGRLKEPCSFADFVLFIAFFPRLLSGPIVRASYFLPQLRTAPPAVNDDWRFEGLALILRGLIKKVILADTLGAHLVDPAFATPERYSTAFLVLAMFGYSFQVYLDLSGYTDMALGAARMLGYRLPGNFNRPYLATSIANFWQRWHITMSSFFRDYLYHALTVSWGASVYVNLLIVFIAIGLWHGAGWNFVVYGCIHGSLVAFEHFLRTRRARKGIRLPAYRGMAFVTRVAIIFGIVALTRVLFRGTDLTSAGQYYAAMLQGTGQDFPLSSHGAAALAIGGLLHFTPTRWRDRLMTYVASRPSWMLAGLFTAAVYFVIIFTRGRGGFIYFQF